MTKQNGVDVWPNTAIWMRDELRSKVRSEENLSQARYPATSEYHITTQDYELLSDDDNLHRRGKYLQWNCPGFLQVLNV